MRKPLDIAVALLVGILLAWLTMYLMGVMAAITIPHSFFVALKGHPIAVSLLHTTLLVQLPSVLLASLIGWLLFRALGQGNLSLVLACSAPWLVNVAMDSITYYTASESPFFAALGMYFGWNAWLGVLGVPLGLWLALKVSQRRTENAP